MPKEVIYNDGHPNNGNSHLRVGWAKDGWVQVATVDPDREPIYSNDEKIPESNGWFIALDRRGINAAIRALRTARDQAYGRDE